MKTRENAVAETRGKLVAVGVVVAEVKERVLLLLLILILLLEFAE